MVEKCVNIIHVFRFSFLDLELVKGRSPSKSLFQRWSYENPSIGDVIDQLYSSGLNRVADFLRETILKGMLIPHFS